MVVKKKFKVKFFIYWKKKTFHSSKGRWTEIPLGLSLVHVVVVDVQEFLSASKLNHFFFWPGKKNGKKMQHHFSIKQTLQDIFFSSSLNFKMFFFTSCCFQWSNWLKKIFSRSIIWWIIMMIMMIMMVSCWCLLIFFLDPLW